MNIIIAALYMGFVLIVSVIKTPEGVDPFTGFDKVVHFLIYGLMGLLWARIFLSRLRGGGGGGPAGRSRGIILRALAVTFFFGLFIELVQSTVPAREASLYDALANGLGGGFGASMYYVFHRYLKIKEGP